MTLEGELPFCVYLLASRRHGTLYLGVTGDLVRRVHQHKSRDVPGFSARYGIERLVWFESYDDPIDALRAKRNSRNGVGIGRFD